MLRILLISLLLTPPSIAATPKVDFKKETQEYLRMGDVRAECTMSMFAMGVPQTYGFVFCDCMTVNLYKAYGIDAIDHQEKYGIQIESLKHECKAALDEVIRKVKKTGEQPSPDKTQ